MATNAFPERELGVEGLNEGRAQPPIPPPVDRWGPLHEPNRSWLSAALAFLRSLDGATLIAVLALIGMVYVAAPLSRPEKEMPTPGVVGIGITVVCLTVIVLMALRVEGTKKDGTHSERCRNEPPNS